MWRVRFTTCFPPKSTLLTKSYLPEDAISPRKSIEDKSSIELTESISVVDPRTKPLKVESKNVFVFAPLKGVASVSSLSVRIASFGTASGIVTTTEVSPELRRPPSSRNLEYILLQ